MSENDTWTEVVRRVGDDPHYHIEVGPDADHLLVEIRYRQYNDETKKFEVVATVQVAPDLIPLLVDALQKAPGELDPG